MRYDLVAFDLDVLSTRDARGSTEEVLREMVELGATLGLVGRVAEPDVRALLGSAQQYFDAFECGPTPPSIVEKVERIIRHLEFSPGRALLVTTTNAEDLAATRQQGVSSAVISRTALGKVTATEPPTHVLAALSEVVNLVAGRPILRIVR